MPKDVADNLVGQVFGRLTVLQRAPRHARHGTRAAWVCRCTCGKLKAILGKSIRRGTQSCGCLTVETTIRRLSTHGRCKTNEYRTWCAARTRCTNPNVACYPNYGARGITMCDRWLNSFEAFFADMGTRPKGCTLGRIDNNGPYSPENCRWETRTQQNNNTSVSKFLTFNGERHTVAEWERLLNFNTGILKCRIQDGWSVKRALTVPVLKRHMVTFRGEIRNLTEWARRIGVHPNTLTKRLRIWTLDRALTEPVQKQRT